MIIDAWLQHPTRRFLLDESGLSEEARSGYLAGNALRVFSKLKGQSG